MLQLIFNTIISRSLVVDDDENDVNSIIVAIASPPLPSSSVPLSPPPPLNEPRVRVWELNENSTHYDRLVAAPSEEDAIRMWAGWAGISLITGVLITCVFIPLVANTAVIRKNPFNLYLLFLLIPDMLFGWFCGGTCLANAIAERYASEAGCRFQSFYVIASFCANSNLNALVARQLYNMLVSSHRFRRYKPPTRFQVILEALGVYLYSTVLALLAVLPTSWGIPHQTRLINGTACVPMSYDTASTIFFYCVFFPMLFGIPFGYVCYTAFQIWNQKLLPRSGRRRVLTIYFFRLAAVFVIMWIPGLLLIFVLGGSVNPWIQWIGGSWSHLQGAVSALVSLLKPDIWKTVRNFWVGCCCCCCGGVDLLSESSMGVSTSQRRRQQESSSSGPTWSVPDFTSVISVMSNRSLYSNASRQQQQEGSEQQRWPLSRNKGSSKSGSIWNLFRTSSKKAASEERERQLQSIHQEITNYLAQAEAVVVTTVEVHNNIQGKQPAVVLADDDDDDDDNDCRNLPDDDDDGDDIEKGNHKNERSFDDDDQPYDDEISGVTLGSMMEEEEEEEEEEEPQKEGDDNDQRSLSLISAAGAEEDDISRGGNNEEEAEPEVAFARSLNLGVERNFMVVAFEQQRRSQSMPELPQLEDDK